MSSLGPNCVGAICVLQKLLPRENISGNNLSLNYCLLLCSCHCLKIVFSPLRCAQRQTNFIVLKKTVRWVFEKEFPNATRTTVIFFFKIFKTVTRSNAFSITLHYYEATASVILHWFPGIFYMDSGEEYVVCMNFAALFNYMAWGFKMGDPYCHVYCSDKWILTWKNKFLAKITKFANAVWKTWKLFWS